MEAPADHFEKIQAIKLVAFVKGLWVYWVSWSYFLVHIWLFDVYSNTFVRFLESSNQMHICGAGEQSLKKVSCQDLKALVFH